MIILSQAGDRIINFEQIKFIEKDDTAIFANIGAEGKYAFICLGNYSTLERAEEVLKDIIKAINGENFVEYNETTLDIHSFSIHSLEQKVFYMPKE